MALAAKFITGSVCCTPWQRPSARRIHCLKAWSRAQSHEHNTLGTGDDKLAALNRRQALLGLVAACGVAGSITPGAALAAKAKEEKPPTIVNDPATLKAQLESQYQQWSSGQFNTWLAGQPETIKWSSTYTGVPMKFKGKAGAQQYFAMLNADLDIQSYNPLAIFVDNDGDEATVVVEASGASKRTQQAFKTVFLHMYTIGPGGQLIKFKEMTDTTLMAQLVSPPAVGGPGAPVPERAAPQAAPGGSGQGLVAPGPGAPSV